MSVASASLAGYSANIANTSLTYDGVAGGQGVTNPALLRSQLGFIGSPLVTTLSSNTALTTGNAVTSVIFRAEANCFVYSTDFTIAIAGTGATSNVSVFLVAANNGANGDSSYPPGNVALGNSVIMGVNVAGNTANTGPYTYNVFANGLASSTNTANLGGFFVTAGSLLVANSTMNTGYIACSTQYRIAPNAVFTA